MTPAERSNPEILNGSRRTRIAKGSGTTIQEVNRLLKQFDQTRKMMKMVTSSKMGKMMPKMKNKKNFILFQIEGGGLGFLLYFGITDFTFLYQSAFTWQLQLFKFSLFTGSCSDYSRHDKPNIKHCVLQGIKLCFRE